MSTQQHKPHTKILPEAELTVPKNFDDDHPISFAKSGGKSVGIVTPQKIHFDTPLTLECNRTLPFFDLMVETYGELNADKSNAILICHALSGSHHAAGYHSSDDKKAGW